MNVQSTQADSHRTIRRDILTPSELMAFQFCRLYHEYRYGQRMIPLEENARFTLWKAVSRGLAAWYERFDLSLARHAIEESLLESLLQPELLPLAIGMLEHYETHWKDMDGFNVLQIDLPVMTPIVTPSGRASRIQDLACIVPLVLEKPDGTIWVMMHRIVSRKEPNLSERLETDLRVRTMAWMLNHCLPGGIEGVIVNVLRSKLPAEPEILKSGKVSKRVNIDTTLGKFTDALNRTGSDPADYTVILDRLSKETDSFFRRWERKYTTDEMERTGKELYIVSRDLRRSSREPVYGNSNSCTLYGTCPYLDLCIGGSGSQSPCGSYLRLDYKHPAFLETDLDMLRIENRRRRRKHPDFLAQSPLLHRGREGGCHVENS